MIQVSVVHQAALGDSFLLLPLFRSLRQRFGECAITLVTKTNIGQMMTMRGYVDGYASADAREHTAWFSPPESAERANSQPFWALADIVISAVSTGNDAWAANARLTRRGLASGFPQGELLFFHPIPPADFAGHVTAWHRQQLSALGLAEAPLPPVRVNPDGAVLIHPGSGGDAKCWPRERFLSLGRTLKRLGIMPTFILGEVEQERWGRGLIEQFKEEFGWYLHMGLYELAERMARARLYVGNDAGVTHVAAALGLPVIALFGPSNDVLWRPLGPAVQILRAPAPHQQQLDALEESTVLAEILAEFRKL